MAFGSGEAALLGDDYEILGNSNDAALLMKACRHEKAAPVILPFQDELVERIKEQIKLLEITVDDFKKSGMDPIPILMYQMDLNRTQFLIRSYLRIRLRKIEKYMLHASSNSDVQKRLSKLEQIFAKRCSEALENHLKQSLLSKLPEHYQSTRKQSSTSQDDDMIPKPSENMFVFCKSNTYVGRIDYDDRYEPLDMVSGDLYILPYGPIKHLMESGKIDLV